LYQNRILTRYNNNNNNYSNSILLLLTILSIIVIISVTAIEGSPNTSYAAATRILPDFSFAAAGDWACNSNTINTVKTIQKINPNLVLGLGDYYYSDYHNESRSPDCWFNIIKPIEQKMKIAIGNHENDPPSLLKLFMNHFNLTKEYYSFNYRNVHFIALSTEIPLSIGSEQYNFVNSDLAKASSDPNIKWIIVYYHKKAYSSPSIVGPFAPVRDTYHPLFDKYHVDLVLNTDMHNYQRSYPIKYNSINPTKPIIDTKNTNTSSYTNPQGRIFVIAGTAGAHFFPLYGKAPYIITQFLAHGFLDIAITNNGKTLSGKFYDNDGSIKDQFTIEKSS
jgi:Calcineurin-like phosphoesterase